jgi:VanZ family protein
MKLLDSLLHDARWQPAWRAVLLVLMCVAAWFAFIPATPAAQPNSIDKVEHLLAFAALGVAALFTASPGLRRLVQAAAGLLLYGAFIELVQTQLPTRQADWADLVADGLGVAIGLGLAALMRRAVRR